MDKMFATERRNIILDLLKERKRVTVKELSSKLNVSEATLRSDLNVMENQGHLKRTHGGAVLDEDIKPENSFTERAKKNKEQKISITTKAVDLIKEENCILLDASTTALELARMIKTKQTRLTVVTNGISTAVELKENPAITAILIGGMLRVGSMALEGSLGTAVLDKINVDMMFTSASGFTIEDGLTDFNVYEVDLKKAMIKKASRVIALLDHSKIGNSSIATFARTDQIDMVITDEPVSPEIADGLLQHDIKLVY